MAAWMIQFARRPCSINNTSNNILVVIFYGCIRFCDSLIWVFVPSAAVGGTRVNDVLMLQRDKRGTYHMLIAPSSEPAAGYGG
jgi:hypothetical protein